MLQPAPDAIDILDFQFQIFSRLKIFDNVENETFQNPCNLVASASRYGVAFVGTNSSKIQAIQLNKLGGYSLKDGFKCDYPRRELSLPSRPHHLSVNCDHTLLSVVVERGGCPVALFYAVQAFFQPTPINPVQEVRLSPTPGVYVIEIGWNPTVATAFTACKSDGTLGTFELRNPGVDINEIPPASQATCFCWSPKGKQIAVGSRDGKITQYKPDLKAVKVVNAPTFDEPHSLIALQWISNYQFVGVFRSCASVDGQSCVVVVDAPKAGDVKYTNYFDVCFSGGCVRPAQFYMLVQSQLNIITVASSNSIEVGVLGNANDIWQPWTVPDSGRAELPLSPDRKENLPIGMAIDASAIDAIPWKDYVLPPAPRLLILSNYGVLCCFNMLNLKEGAAGLCAPPDPIANESQYFTVAVMKTDPKPSSEPINLSAINNNYIPPPVVSINPSPIITAVSSSSSLIIPSTVKPVEPLLPVDKVDDTVAATTVEEVSTVDTEPLYARMVNDECQFLQAEVKALLTQGRAIKVAVGTDAEMCDIARETNSIEQFLKEIIDITNGQNSEVHSLKENLLRSFAWYEEAKSRHKNSTNRAMELIVKRQPLDPVSEKQLHDVRHLGCYLESQLAQASRALDEQWELFQDYCRKNYQMQLPTMEVIFQTMVKQNAISDRQTYLLKDISSKIRNKARTTTVCGNSGGPSLLLSLDNVQDLEDELTRLRLEPHDIAKVQVERVQKRMNCLIPTKVDRMRNFLRNRTVPKVSSIVKLQLNDTNSILLGKSTQISGRLSSPVRIISSVDPQKDSINKNQKFLHSTPKPAVIKPVPQKFGSLDFTSTTKPLSSVNSAFVAKPPQDNKDFGKIATTTITTSSSSIPLNIPKPSFSFGGGGGASSTVPLTFNFSHQTTTPKFTGFATSSTTTTTVNKTGGDVPKFSFASSGGSSAKSISGLAVNTSENVSSFGVKLSSSSTGNEPATVSMSQSRVILTPKVTTTSTTQPQYSLVKSLLSSMTTTATITTSSFLNSSPQTSFSFASSTTAVGKLPAGGFLGSSPATAIASSPSSIALPTMSPLFLPSTTSMPSYVASSSSVLTSSGSTFIPINTASTGIATTSQSLPFFATTITTTATTGSSLFGSKDIGSGFGIVSKTSKPNTIPTTTASSVVTTTSTSLFGAKPSLFGPVTSSTLFDVTSIATTTTSTSSFSFGGGTMSSQQSLFGTNTITTTTTTMMAKTIPATTSMVSTPQPLSTTQVVSSLSSLFPSASKSQPFDSSATPLFSSGSIATTTTPSTTANTIFAVATTPSSTSSNSLTSIFGATPTTTTQMVSTATILPASPFSSTPPVSTTTSQFGGSSSIFNTGSSTTSSFQSGGVSTVFGGVVPTTTSSSSIFGQTVLAATTSASLFGGQSTFGSTTGSIFSNSAPTTTNVTNIFGSNTPTTAANTVFGGSSSSGSIFGGGSTQSSSSPFGSVNSNTNSVFGSTITTTTTAALQQPSSTFNFATAAAVTPATNSGAASSSSSFGFGSLNVASSPTSFSQGFGGSPFSAVPSSEKKSVFGGENKSIFGAAPATATTTASSFGSTSTSGGSSIFGQGFGAPAASTFGGGGGQSLFGGGGQQQSPFGQQPQQQSSFAGGFGSFQPGPFSGASAASSTGVAQSAFGAGFQKPASGFGSPGVSGGTTSSVFGGSSPAFGGAPSFGGSPAFGSAPAFGTPPKMFGSSSPTGVFGGGPSTTNQNPTFGNLATQNTVGFGNLAQQADTTSASSPPFSGNSAFSSWR